MRWKKHPDPDEIAQSIEGTRPLRRHTLGFVGLVPTQITELVGVFTSGSREALTKLLREEAGHLWAANAFEQQWAEDEAHAREQGLFDLIWHRRALEVDPFLAAHDYAGLDVLLDISKEAAPEIADLLDHVDGNNPENPRQLEGPDWWRCWHQATRSRPGGWLSVEEVRQVHAGWSELATIEVEEACLGIMGVPYTHPGCWTLLDHLGGFFAQCSSESRAVLVEVDL